MCVCVRERERERERERDREREREKATYSSLAEQLNGPVWCAEDDRHSFTCALFGKTNKHKLIQQSTLLYLHVPVEFKQVQYFVLFLHTTLNGES